MSLFEVIERGTDHFGMYEIAINHSTDLLYKRVTSVRRGEVVWTEWYKF